MFLGQTMLSFINFKTIGSLVLACAVLFAPLPSMAQSQADKKFAQEAFKQGQIQYNLGRFEKALEHFSKAYETMPHGAFLFNIGQCHRQLNDHQKAVFFFEGYLRALPTAPNRQEVEDLITEHNAKLSIEKAQSRKVETKKKKPKKQKKTAATTKKKANKTTPAATSAPKNKASTAAAPTTESWILWTVIGCVGLIGTGIGLIAVINRTNANNNSNGLEDNTLGEYDLSK